MYLTKIKTVLTSDKVDGFVSNLQKEAPLLQLCRKNIPNYDEKEQYVILARTLNAKNNISSQPLVNLGNFPTECVVALCDNPILGTHVSDSVIELIRSYEQLEGSLIEVHDKANTNLKIVEINLVGKYQISLDILKEISKAYDNICLHVYVAYYTDVANIKSLKEYAISGNDAAFITSVSSDSDDEVEFRIKLAVNMNTALIRLNSDEFEPAETAEPKKLSMM